MTQKYKRLTKMNRAEISRSTKESSKEWIEKFPKVAAMERDPRGLPIPANVSRDSKNGKPIFAITNPIQEIELFCSQKCAVTETLLNVEDVWFITTPDLAFVPFGLLLDAPMCGEAKDFTLRVCPYFGVRNYDRLSDTQAKAMAPKLSEASSGKRYETPAELVAVKVTGFQGEPTADGMRYLPSRHYASMNSGKSATVCVSLMVKASGRRLLRDWKKPRRSVLLHTVAELGDNVSRWKSERAWALGAT